VAATGDGVADLWGSVRDHRAYLASSGELERRRERRLLDELHDVLVSKIVHDLRTAESGAIWERVKQSLLKREIDPYEAAEGLLIEK
jgi:LAO/AO transport system kinase